MNVLHLDLGLEFRGGQRQVLYLACFQKLKKQVHPYLVCPLNTPLKTKAPEQGIETLTLLPDRSLIREIGLSSCLFSREKISI